MKKTVIGSVFMLSGILSTLGIMIIAVLYVPLITEWSGSKLWFAIFGAERFGNEVVDSLFLGFPFIIGAILFLIGLLMLMIQYFKKNS